MFTKFCLVLFNLTLFLSILFTEGDSTNTYLVNIYLSILLFVIFVLNLLNKRVIDISYVDLVLFLILGYIYIQHYMSDLVDYKITIYYELFIYAVIFVIYRNFSKQYKQISQKVFFYSVLGCNIFEIIRLFFSELNLCDTITNHWGNTGIFAIFLSLNCIIITFNYHSFYYNCVKLFFITLFIIDIILIIYFKSRLSFVIVSSFFLYVLNQRFCVIKLKYLIIICTVILLTISFLVKTNSSFGRLLIVKVSFEMLCNNPIIGVGGANFSTEYPKYQAKYYSDSKMSDNEVFLADNTITALNEPLQIVCELGVVGFLLLLSISLLILKYLNENCESLIILVFSLVFASFFYYILHITFFILASLFLFAIYFSNDEVIIRIDNKWIFSLSIAFIMILLHFIPKFTAMYSKHNDKSFYYSGFHKELDDNSIYLCEYIEYLFNNGNYDEAFKIIQRLKKYVLWDKALIIEGDYYYSKKLITKSEHAYLLAKSICPAKFYARYKLFNLYKNTDNRLKTYQEAVEIINLKEKIPSPTSLAIKINVKNYLDSIKL